jgi:hypothetical protein
VLESRQQVQTARRRNVTELGATVQNCDFGVACLGTIDPSVHHLENRGPLVLSGEFRRKGASTLIQARLALAGPQVGDRTKAR